MTKWVDQTGVQRLWYNVKNALNKKADKAHTHEITIGSTTVAVNDIISYAVFPIVEDDDSVTFGNINEWLAAGKPKL